MAPAPAVAFETFDPVSPQPTRMHPVDRSEFRRSVRRLDERALARLVAATWRARGAEVAVDGDVVTVSRGDGPRRLRVVCGRWATRRLSASPDVDAFVVDRPVASPPDGVDVVDPDDLRERLLYALPRERGREIAAAHLGLSLLVEESEPTPSLRDRLPVTDPPFADALPSAAAVVVGTLLVLALVGSAGGLWTADGAGWFGGSDDGADGTSTRGGGEGAAADARAGSDDDARTTAARQSTADEEATGGSAFPPGLGPDGITDPYLLAEAHADAVTNRSYTLVLAYVESANGTVTSRQVERVSVASPTNYATNVSSEGIPSMDSPVVADVEAYADGEVRWERRISVPPRSDGGMYSKRTAGTDRSPHDYYADRVERYLGWYLSVENSTVEDILERNGVTYYWVRLGTDSYPGVENASGRALVTDEGVVVRLERTYETPEPPNATATVRIVYTNRGDSPVDEPPWVAKARNATAE